MSFISELSRYLQETTGQPTSLTEAKGACLNGLPLLLASSARFFQWRWLDQSFVIAELHPDNLGLKPSELEYRQRLLGEHFKQEVILTFPRLSAYLRNRLVANRVPFIVPGSQLFIPPLANLREQYERASKRTHLSAAAQLTIIYQLLRKPPDHMMLNQWAAKLNYSAMTMTSVRDELVAVGVCEKQAGAKPRGLAFNVKGRDLWDLAQPHLRSPVRRTMYARINAKSRGLFLAGLSSLGKRTMIQEDVLPSYACHEQDWRSMLASKQASRQEHEGNANALIESWRYRPEILAEGRQVDALSLNLSFRGEADERIRAAADSLLEQVIW